MVWLLFQWSWDVEVDEVIVNGQGRELRRRKESGDFCGDVDGGGKVGSFMTAKSLAGGEDPVTVRAIEEHGLTISSIGIGIGGSNAF